MADGFDDVYVDTRRQLRGVAASFIAGPQHRASGTIRLAARPDGVYEIVDPLSADAVLDIDAAAAEWIHAPFGAARALDPGHDVDALTSRIADFFERAARERSKQP